MTIQEAVRLCKEIAKQNRLLAASTIPNVSSCVVALDTQEDESCWTNSCQSQIHS